MFQGICFVIVFLYYQRLRGKLISERAGGHGGRIVWEKGINKLDGKRNAQKLQHFTNGTPNLPPWIDSSLPDKPPPAIERKLRRKERKEWEMGQKLANSQRNQHQRKSSKLAQKRGVPTHCIAP